MSDVVKNEMDIMAILADKEFEAKVNAAANNEEVIALFAERGLIVNEEMIAEAIDAGEVNAELNENELDNVAGGCIICNIAGGFAYLVVRAGGGSRADAKKAKNDVKANFKETLHG